MTLEIECPPIELQAEFVRRVELLRRTIATQRKSMEKLDGAFQSLQVRAFEGEL